MTSEPIQTISDSIKTGDGSYTLRHPELGELYHAQEGAWSEAESKFILPSRLSERLHRGPVKILDVGFGLGINTLCAVNTEGPGPLDILTLDHDAGVWERAASLQPENRILQSLACSGTWQEGNRSVRALETDLRLCVKELKPEFDLIFHDPFRPLVNTGAWTEDVFKALLTLLCPDGALLTYSQSRIIRAGLVAAGFRIGETVARPPHRGGTIAGLSPEVIPAPLPTPENGWGPPFRDPELNRDDRDIRSLREAEVRDLHSR